MVDDEPSGARLLCAKLAKRGFETQHAASGEECLERLAVEQPDIILLDIVMPGLSGMDVLATVRRQFQAVALPIIMVTGKTDASDVVDALNAGANDYVTKPVQIDVAVARIETQLMIADLTRESSRKAELETANAMVATYNHEINNPLAIALGYLEYGPERIDETKWGRIRDALNRIAEIVRQIDHVTQSSNIEHTEYTKHSTMIKIR